MHIKEDYSYISADNQRLIDKGLGKISVYSLNFDRHYLETEMQENIRSAQSMSEEEFQKHCIATMEYFDGILGQVLRVLCSKYDIHQSSKEKTTNKHYQSNWDLFFYSNRGWNGTNYMDHFSLTFNESRSTEENTNLLAGIIDMLRELDGETFKNIGCRIQYQAVLDNDKVAEAAQTILDGLIGKTVEYNGMTGKIKLVSDVAGVKGYGFFKKYAKEKYYKISETDAILTFGQ